jgi:hypothetical protein
MNAYPDNFSSPTPEALPAEFEPQLAEVDRLLARALHHEAPAGLSQRVFEMSVESLPASSDEARETPHLRLVGSGIDTDQRGAYERRFALALSTWRRHALAACTLLVAGAALWISWPRATSPSPIAPSNIVVHFDPTEFNGLSVPTDADSLESEVAYLFDSTEVRSLRDLSSDLRQIVQQLEM